MATTVTLDIHGVDRSVTTIEGLAGTGAKSTAPKDGDYQKASAAWLQYQVPQCGR